MDQEREALAIEAVEQPLTDYEWDARAYVNPAVQHRPTRDEFIETVDQLIASLQALRSELVTP